MSESMVPPLIMSESCRSHVGVHGTATNHVGVMSECGDIPPLRRRSMSESIFIERENHVGASGGILPMGLKEHFLQVRVIGVFLYEIRNTAWPGPEPQSQNATRTHVNIG